MPINVKAPSKATKTQASRKRAAAEKPAPKDGADPQPCAALDPTAGADSKAIPSGKLGVLVELLSRPQGATIDAMSQATGWQNHSVRGALSGALKKKRGFSIASESAADGRIYRITASPPAAGPAA